MGRSVHGVVQDATGVIVAAHIGGAALLSAWGHPGVDADAKIYGRIGKPDALHVDQVVYAVAVRQLVGHPNNRGGEAGPRILRINRGLQI